MPAFGGIVQRRVAILIRGATFAPFLINKLTNFRLPFAAALCKGVMRCSARTSTLAPLPIKEFRDTNAAGPCGNIQRGTP